MDFLIKFLSQIVAWIVQFGEWIIEWIATTVLSALIVVLNAIPVPGWLSGSSSVFAAMPSGFVYLVQGLQLPVGLGIILSAYTIRFLIRRVPFIG